nr:hypothetical protein [Legionella jordanis]
MIGLLGVIIGSCSTGYYQIKTLKSQNSIKFIEQYSRNMQIINTCKNQLKQSILKFGDSSTIKINYAAAEKVNQIYFECIQSTYNLIYLSHAVNANDSGLNCYSELLNNNKTKFNEILHRFVGKPIPIAEIDPLIGNQNRNWDSCQQKTQEDFEIFSKNQF